MAKDRWNLKQISNSFESIIANEINTYAKELEINADKATEEVAKMFVEDLRPNIPESDGSGGKFGHLADNLNYKTVIRNDVKIQIVNFGLKYYIAHLLENGWTLRNGKFLRRKPFIRPTYDQNENKYYNHIKNSLGGGK